MWYQNCSMRQMCMYIFMRINKQIIYIYIYVYMSVCICFYQCMHLSNNMYIYIYVCVRMFLSIYTFICISLILVHIEIYTTILRICMYICQSKHWFLYLFHTTTNDIHDAWGARQLFWVPQFLNIQLKACTHFTQLNDLPIQGWTSLTMSCCLIWL